MSSKLISVGAVIVLFSIIQTIEGFVLQPKIVGKGAGLHPLIVLLALITGGQFGIGGMIIAVPIASMVQVLIKEYYWLPLLEKEKEMKSEIEETNPENKPPREQEPAEEQQSDSEST